MAINKTTFLFITGVVLFLTIVAGYFLFNNFYSRDNGAEDAKPAIYLKPDKGINIEYLNESTPEDLGGERSMFERYRFYDIETDEQVDIRDEDIKVFVSEPNGAETEITIGSIYYLMRIYPVANAGEYTFRLMMPDGAQHTAKLDMPQVRPAELILGSEYINQNTGSLLQSINIEGVDLNEAGYVMHVLQDNSVYELKPDIEGKVSINSEVLGEGHHVFLTKYRGVWHSAVFFNPEE